MTKPRQDPRHSKCIGISHQKHRWARQFKDKISKTKFVAILRCRYCANYVCVEFERVVLPSGRVTVTERAFETTKVDPPPGATVELRDSEPSEDDLKAIEAEGITLETENGRLHT